MENLQQRTSKGINILKDKALLFIIICLLSSIISIFAVPFFVSNTFTKQDINEGINQIGETYAGILTFSAEEMIVAITLLFQSLVFLTVLIIIAYIVKQTIDKKMFRLNRWRDWKFFLYLSGISLIIVNIFQKIVLNIGDNFIINLLLITISSLVIIIISSILLPEELSKIDIAETWKK